MPDESHTLKPWTAESNPPTTSTQPGRAEVVDQIKQVVDDSAFDHGDERAVQPYRCAHALGLGMVEAVVVWLAG
jgi:hypothetical protein